MTQQNHKHLKHQEGPTQTKGNESYWINKLLQYRETRFSDMWTHGSSLQLACVRSTDKQGKTQTGSRLLMSVLIYCHWEGCCILGTTAAFSIDSCILKGSVHIIKKGLAEEWMQWRRTHPFSPWELSWTLLYPESSVFVEKKAICFKQKGNGAVGCSWKTNSSKTLELSCTLHINLTFTISNTCHTTIDCIYKAPDLWPCDLLII